MIRDNLLKQAYYDMCVYDDMSTTEWSKKTRKEKYNYLLPRLNTLLYQYAYHHKMS